MTAARTELVLLDVNGTLTDPRAIGDVWQRPELGEMALERAVATAMTEALLGGMRHRFDEHLRAGLELLVAERALDPALVDEALKAAAALPARRGASAALASLRERGIRLVALTNSGMAAGERTLEACGLIGCLERVLGTDAVATFKPHPAVYAYALEELRADPARTVLIATHPWDLAGGAHAGIATAWVTHGARRWPAVLPPPALRAETLPELAALL